MINTLCVIHLCAQNGEPEFRMACATAGADLRGKAHWHARVRLLRGSGLGASVPVRVRGNNSSRNEARAGLCGVAADMAAAEWQRWNAGVVFWLPEWHTCHYSTRKRKRGILKCSPRPEIEQGGGVGSSAAKIGNESRVALGEGSLQRSEQTAAGSRKFLASRRSRCAAWPGLRCGGAAESRRHSGSAPAQRVRVWRWGAEVAAVWRG